MAEKKQFDEFLGGEASLPRDANVLKLASARASEMAAMTYSLGSLFNVYYSLFVIKYTVLLVFCIILL